MPQRTHAWEKKLKPCNKQLVSSSIVGERYTPTYCHEKERVDTANPVGAERVTDLSEKDLSLVPDAGRFGFLIEEVLRFGQHGADNSGEERKSSADLEKWSPVVLVFDKRKVHNGGQEVANGIALLQDAGVNAACSDGKILQTVRGS